MTGWLLTMVLLLADRCQIVTGEALGLAYPTRAACEAAPGNLGIPPGTLMAYSCIERRSA